VYVIWLDEARHREQLALAFATWAITAAKAGAKRHEIGEWTDPADLMDDAEDDTASASRRERDPAARAAQIRAFLAGAGAADIT
jgi:hypothetical protein